MAVQRQPQRRAYGIGNALQDLGPQIIIAERSPTIADKPRAGTKWINKLTNSYYVTTGPVQGEGVWLNLAGGSGVFDSIVATTGNITANVGDLVALLGDVVIAQGNISAPNGSINAANGTYNQLTVNGPVETTGTFTLDSETDGVLLTDNAGLITATQGTDGQLLIGATGAAPAFANLTSTGMTIDITEGPNTLNIERGGAAGISDFEADGPSNAQPNAGIIEFLGGSNITTSAATNQVTFDLDDNVTITGALVAGTTLASTTTTTVGNGLTVTAGDATITAGSLILPTTTSTAGQVTIAGNRWLHSYGTNNTFAGSNSGNFTLTGTGNCALGQNTLTALTSGSGNCAIGLNALTANTTGSNNTAIGFEALENNIGGLNNIAIGYQALNVATGNSNTAIGSLAGVAVSSGENNLLLGYNAGSAYTTESNNICLMNVGVASDADTMRIGNSTHTSCRIYGIYGASVGGTNAAVLVDDTGLLGTAVSSARFKENIHDMGSASDALLKMRPVTFNYKSNPDHLVFGLIAEEVNDVMPDLVNLDDEGLPHNVKYHDLPSLLLHQIQKMAARIESLESKASTCSCRN